MRQAVHAGADLQSAAASVLGYRQPSLKGKAILVEPVPNVATPAFKEIISDVLAAQQLQVSQPSEDKRMCFDGICCYTAYDCHTDVFYACNSRFEEQKFSLNIFPVSQRRPPFSACSLPVRQHLCALTHLHAMALREAYISLFL